MGQGSNNKVVNDLRDLVALGWCVTRIAGIVMLLKVTGMMGLAKNEFLWHTIFLAEDLILGKIKK